MANPPLPKVLPLTSIRFFAAFSVLLYHSLATLPVGSPFFRAVLGYGYVNVSFFFMLSGFILAIVYLKDDRPIEKRRFYLARFARIYPLYLAAMLLDTPHFFHAQLFLQHKSIWQALGTFFATTGLVQTWFHLQGPNLPGWSLCAEAFFYLLFPFLGTLLWKARGWSILSLFVLIYCAGLAVVFVIIKVQGHDGQGYHPVPHLFIFLLGILLARFFVQIAANPKWAQMLNTFAPLLFAGSIAGFLMIPLFHLKISEAQLQHGLLAPLFSGVLLSLASGNRLLSSLFSARWLVTLGEASYGIYLLHVPLYTILRRPIERFGFPMFLLYAAMTIALSVITYFQLEVPARRWILKKTSRTSEARTGSPLIHQAN
ncbi:acyltransferase family protein [Edaphobacter flagellatus]|uniref:acyltransferase family protein n=1 Tax=Edaphobacter flagellatus TaxID=1933044 RepID=UPI0021B17BFE|nr:acyltransferase [Edaphobacter flagellatus]